MDDRRLIHHVETNLKKIFVIGAGNALYLQGWCYHTIQRIKKLYILVDDVPHLVSNFSFARPDVFQKHFPKKIFLNYAYSLPLLFPRVLWYPQFRYP